MEHSIYFISAPEVGRFKIGRTAASIATGRLAALQVGSPCVLELIHAARGPASLEEACHLAAVHLDFYRVRGEWFDGDINAEDCEAIVAEARRFEALNTAANAAQEALEKEAKQIADKVCTEYTAKQRGDISVATTTSTIGGVFNAV